MSVSSARQAFDLNFSTTISLTSEDNDRYQMIYVTQLYETMFALYARFVVDPDYEDDAVIALKQIEFLGVNYKGPVNLKIENIHIEVTTMQDDDEDNDPAEDQDEEDSNNLLFMQLTLSGTGDGTFSYLPMNLENVEQVDPNNIQDLRTLINVDLEVPKNASFRIERVLKSMSRFEDRNPLKIKLPDDASVNGVFDSEFFRRDGFLVAPKNGGRPFEFRLKRHLQNFKTSDMFKKEFNPFAASSIVCPIGVGKIASGS